LRFENTLVTPLTSTSNMQLTSEQLRALQIGVGQLSKEERKKLLKMLHSSIDEGMNQFNSDESNSYQVVVKGGTAYIGDINININTPDLEDMVREIISDQIQSLIPNDYSLNEVDIFFEEEEDEDDYYTEEYTNNYDWEYSRKYSKINFWPIVVGGITAIGVGIFLSRVGGKMAVVQTPPNLGAAYVKDDVANIKESLLNGTTVWLTGKRDGGGYCETDRGWIYCAYLAENVTKTSAIKNPLTQIGETIPSIKTAIVQPDAGFNAAKLRAKPNAGKVIGQIPRGHKVQVIRCIDDGCEVNNGSIQGWIYKPYLRQ
jgi:hypothetical protein